MNNQTDLDWLARNVHEWPAGKNFVNVSRGVYFYITKPSDVKSFTQQQWLTRRAELQNKPSWDDAPEWATHLAQRHNGRWLFLKNGEFGTVTWKADKIWDPVGRGEVIGDWRDTLERRPVDLSSAAVIKRLDKATQNVLAAATELKSDKFKFEPITSIEDNQEQDMTRHEEIKQQDNSWFERGGMPPVGTVCEVLWNEGRMEYLRTKVFGVNEHGQPIHRFDEGPKKFEYQADPLVTVLGTKVFRTLCTEREKAIDELKSLLKITCLADHENLDVIAAAIYAAGYRKESK